MSRIGNSPIQIPSGVDVQISGNHITVKGPKGNLERDFDKNMVRFFYGYVYNRTYCFYI